MPVGAADVDVIVTLPVGVAAGEEAALCPGGLRYSVRSHVVEAKFVLQS